MTNSILNGVLLIAILDLLLELAGFTHVLAGFTQCLKKRLFPAKTCYFRPAIRNSRWLAGKSPRGCTPTIFSTNL